MFSQRNETNIETVVLTRSKNETVEIVLRKDLDLKQNLADREIDRSISIMSGADFSPQKNAVLTPVSLLCRQYCAQSEYCKHFYVSVSYNYPISKQLSI
jgi:hypothetical protein